jgi:hypothetical protein
MYPATLAERLRARGHDVISIHEPPQRDLEGAADAEVFRFAAELGRALVTENVPDYRRLEAAALAAGKPLPVLIFTTNRQFPRGEPQTLGRLVRALTQLLETNPPGAGSIFLKPIGTGR